MDQAQHFAQPHQSNLFIRFIALLIDMLIIGIPYVALFFLLRFTLWQQMPQDQFRNLVGIVGPFTNYVYLTFMEATTGTTPGKKTFRLSVVTITGEPMGWQQAALRNIVLPIDLLMGGLVGAILIWFTPLHQRLGDLAAKTLIIRQ